MPSRLTYFSGELMRLQRVSLQSKRFAIQLSIIIKEFGNRIPWLSGLDAYTTNDTHAVKQFLRRMRHTRCRVAPYELVLDNRPKEFIGWIFVFNRSPERFEDPILDMARANLERENKARFITCLYVMPEHRGRHVGTSLMQLALRIILRKKSVAWGIVSNHSLLPWYESLGAQIQNPNDDNKLRIIVWRRNR